MTHQQRRRRESASKGRQNSYRKNPDPAGENPDQIDIQQPGKAGDFGNGETRSEKPAGARPG